MKMHVDIGYGVVLFAVEASTLGSGRPCGVYMFSGLHAQVFNILHLFSWKEKYLLMKIYYIGIHTT